jgi:hypothetical protein
MEWLLRGCRIFLRQAVKDGFSVLCKVNRECQGKVVGVYLECYGEP